MFTSSKLRILRTFSANDWNNPELYHSPSLIIALQIKTTSTLSSNAENLRKADLHIIKQH